MKVYSHNTSNNMSLYVQPAIHYPEVSAWKEPDGRAKMFEIRFKDGEAEVEDNLGYYLIEKKLAFTTKIILPNEVA